MVNKSNCAFLHNSRLQQQILAEKGREEIFAAVDKTLSL